MTDENNCVPIELGHSSKVPTAPIVPCDNLGLALVCTEHRNTHNIPAIVLPTVQIGSLGVVTAVVGILELFPLENNSSGIRILGPKVDRTYGELPLRARSSMSHDISDPSAYPIPETPGDSGTNRHQLPVSGSPCFFLGHQVH
jgi:hypothetical protein